MRLAECLIFVRLRRQRVEPACQIAFLRRLFEALANVRRGARDGVDRIELRRIGISVGKRLGVTERCIGQCCALASPFRKRSGLSPFAGAFAIAARTCCSSLRFHWTWEVAAERQRSPVGWRNSHRLSRRRRRCTGQGQWPCRSIYYLSRAAERGDARNGCKLFVSLPACSDHEALADRRSGELGFAAGHGIGA